MTKSNKHEYIEFPKGKEPFMKWDTSFWGIRAKNKMEILKTFRVHLSCKCKKQYKFTLDELPSEDFICECGEKLIGYDEQK